MSDTFDPPVGIAQELEPMLRRIVAPNPSPMTNRGTNTYLLGARALAVIDPGPKNMAHMDAILSAVGPDQRISHIFVSHSHLDHSPLARPLAQATGAPVLAFGDVTAGRSKVMRRLAKAGLSSGGEGLDYGFKPDIEVPDGARIETADWSLDVIHTPGHLGNHICLHWKDACFTADHVMGWASSLVSPPDGDLTDFMASCRRLGAQRWRIFYPGHGDVIAKPQDRLTWLIAHRQQRERAILATLAQGPMDAPGLTARIYVDTPAKLLPAAERNVLAHLIDLQAKSKVQALGSFAPQVQFQRLENQSQ